jgi:hypothetical protein
MTCQQCGKACVNRTEGRPVMLSGQLLFFCNACSLHAVQWSGAGEITSTRGILRPFSQSGDRGAPPEAEA